MGLKTKDVTYNTDGGADSISRGAKVAATHNFIEAMKKFDEIIRVKMDFINDVSLEDEDYNELYLALREMSVQISRVFRAQYKIDNRVEEDALWDAMKKFRDPDTEFEIENEPEFRGEEKPKKYVP